MLVWPPAHARVDVEHRDPVAGGRVPLRRPGGVLDRIRAGPGVHPGVDVGAGRFGLVNTLAWRSPSAVSTPYSSSGASVPPPPRIRCTVPWLVSNVPVSVVVTGCGRYVWHRRCPVAISVPAMLS